MNEKKQLLITLVSDSVKFVILLVLINITDVFNLDNKAKTLLPYIVAVVYALILNIFYQLKFILIRPIKIGVRMENKLTKQNFTNVIHNHSLADGENLILLKISVYPTNSFWNKVAYFFIKKRAAVLVIHDNKVGKYYYHSVLIPENLKSDIKQEESRIELDLTDFLRDTIIRNVTHSKNFYCRVRENSENPIDDSEPIPIKPYLIIKTLNTDNKYLTKIVNIFNSKFVEFSNIEDPLYTINCIREG